MNFPLPSEYSKIWSLDPGMIFLNHGSFGACPVAILEKQQGYRQRLESQPVRFMMRELETMFIQSRQKVAGFVNASADDLVFVGNVTEAVNTVFRSLRFNPGDELLTTNHIYPACRRLLEFICDQTGARLVEACYEFPISSPDIIIEAVLGKVTPKTRIALIDHITSATAIIQPVEKIVIELENRGIDTMIDGAHALGCIPLDLEKTKAAYYTANCHKWLCAPKSTAILHVRKDKQKEIFPLVVSHGGYNAQPFSERFYWPGTYDPTPALCVGDTIDYLGSILPGGWNELMQRNHQLCIEARSFLCEKLQLAIPCSDSMIASMATLELPMNDLHDRPDYKSMTLFQDYLYHQYHIEIPVWHWGIPIQQLIRIAVQLYNSIDQFRYLGEALDESWRMKQKKEVYPA